MRNRNLSVATALLVLMGLGTATLMADDRVARRDGSELRGNIISIDRNNVTISVTQGRETKEERVPVTRVERVRFDNEPLELDTARRAALRGQHADALADFEGLNQDNLTGSRAEFMKQDITFYKAYCMAYLALTGEKEIEEAAAALNDFVSKHDNSHHLVNAAKLLGDVETARGNFQAAQAAYGRLTNSTLPDVQAQGHVSRGYALLRQGNIDEAQQAFQAAVGTVSDSPQVERSKQLAKIGLAACKAESGNHQAAVSDVRGLLKDTQEDPEIFARAYNALGRAFRKGNEPKEALLAYLHVDVLYGTQSQEHAEALYYLSDLWNTVGDSERAGAARELLQSRYSNSTWANQ